MFRNKIIVAGSGGQGALRVGQMIAYAAVNQGLEATWLPSYGAEMRGGTANCSVTITDGVIGYPMISQADYCIIMNNPSLEKFEGNVCPGGTLIVDSSMVTRPVERKDIRVFSVPADVIAEEEGNTRGANMVMLGAYLAVAGGVSLEAVYENIDHSFTGSKAKYSESNKRLVKRGYDLITAQQG